MLVLFRYLIYLEYIFLGTFLICCSVDFIWDSVFGWQIIGYAKRIQEKSKISSAEDKRKQLEEIGIQIAEDVYAVKFGAFRLSYFIKTVFYILIEAAVIAFMVCYLDFNTADVELGEKIQIYSQKSLEDFFPGMVKCEYSRCAKWNRLKEFDVRCTINYNTEILIWLMPIMMVIHLLSLLLSICFLFTRLWKFVLSPNRKHNIIMNFGMSTQDRLKQTLNFSVDELFILMMLSRSVDNVDFKFCFGAYSDLKFIDYQKKLNL